MNRNAKCVLYFKDRTVLDTYMYTYNINNITITWRRRRGTLKIITVVFWCSRSRVVGDYCHSTFLVIANRHRISIELILSPVQRAVGAETTTSVSEWFSRTRRTETEYPHAIRTRHV